MPLIILCATAIVGRMSQRLEERIKQNLSRILPFHFIVKAFLAAAVVHINFTNQKSAHCTVYSKTFITKNKVSKQSYQNTKNSATKLQSTNVHRTCAKDKKAPQLIRNTVQTVDNRKKVC